MDIIYVSYNSEKWIEKCFDSVLKSNFDLKTVSIVVVDNHSTDHSVEKLKEAKKKCEKELRSFEIVEADSNLGFGKANNLGVSKGSDEIVCFFNIDTEVYLFLSAHRTFLFVLHNRPNTQILFLLSTSIPYKMYMIFHNKYMVNYNRNN